MYHKWRAGARVRERAQEDSVAHCGVLRGTERMAVERLEHRAETAGHAGGPSGTYVAGK